MLIFQGDMQGCQRIFGPKTHGVHPVHSWFGGTTLCSICSGEHTWEPVQYHYIHLFRLTSLRRIVEPLGLNLDGHIQKKLEGELIAMLLYDFTKKHFPKHFQQDWLLAIQKHQVCKFPWNIRQRGFAKMCSLNKLQEETEKCHHSTYSLEIHSST